jgi:hypothetical protein
MHQIANPIGDQEMLEHMNPVLKAVGMMPAFGLKSTSYYARQRPLQT